MVFRVTAGKQRLLILGKSCRAGSVGELIVKGPGVMTCYYNDEKATAETIKDGWLYTGDMAEMDEDGFIYLVDRKKDVIISGGENLYPVQIENFLSKFPKIKDVAVIGLADERLGEIAAAIIELNPDTDVLNRKSMISARNFQDTRDLKKIIFTKVPRNATGKIEKPKLREMYHSSNLLMHRIRLN